MVTFLLSQCYLIFCHDHFKGTGVLASGGNVKSVFNFLTN